MDWLVWVGVALFVCILFAKTILIVPQGMEYTKERLGQYVQTLHPGLHLLIPYLDRIGHRVNVMEQVVEIPHQQVISSDNATIVIDAIGYIQVIDSRKSSYEVSDPATAITQLMITSIRAVLGAMPLDEILSGRKEINGKVMASLDEATAPWGIKVTRAEVRELTPSEDLLEAMSSQMKAERFKRASILEAEGFRSAEITKAEGEKQSTILRAEGLREAAYLNAQAREREAEAEAKATQIVSEAIQNGDPKALDYFLGQKYVESMGALAASSNTKVIMMPTELTSLASTVAGFAGMVGKKS